MEIKDIGDTVEIRLTILEKILSVHGNFIIRKQDIISIKKELPKTSWKELRCPGTFFPGIIKAGSYYTSRGWEFWYWTRLKKYFYTIEIRHKRYKLIVLGTIDPVLINI